MGKNSSSEDFCITVANTDNDPRERHALQWNWPDIHLILCMFHTYQAWRNGLNKHLRIIPRGHICQQVRWRLGAFLMKQLKEIDLYEEALTTFNEEVGYFKRLENELKPLAKKASKGGLAFLV